MSAHHVAASCDYVHETETDYTDARQPTPAQAEAIELLWPGTRGRLVRLSLRDWALVERVVAWGSAPRHQSPHTVGSHGHPETAPRAAAGLSGRSEGMRDETTQEER